VKERREVSAKLEVCISMGMTQSKAHKKVNVVKMAQKSFIFERPERFIVARLSIM
jgi:hypothetical protein